MHVFGTKLFNEGMHMDMVERPKVKGNHCMMSFVGKCVGERAICNKPNCDFTIGQK